MSLNFFLLNFCFCFSIRPKVIPVPIPLPVPVPVPIRGKSPLNIFGSHSEQSNSQSFPNFPNHSYLQYPFPHQHPPPPLISPLALPYLHPGYPPYSHLYPPIGHSLIPPSAPVPSPNFSPFPSIAGQQQLMATNQLSQKMILPYGLLSHPHGSAYHQHHINQQVYHPSPLIGQHNLYPHGTIHPSTYYSGPFVIYFK